MRGYAEPIEILLVEDNPADVRLTQKELERSKISNNLVVLGDGEQALAFLRREGEHADARRPDLILLDLNLPRKDGREVLADVKADPYLRRIPVLVLTTSAGEEDVIRAYDLQAACYITKPVDLEQFVNVIRSIENFWMTIVTLPPATDLR